jgi:hypothetical protein
MPSGCSRFLAVHGGATLGAVIDERESMAYARGAAIALHTLGPSARANVIAMLRMQGLTVEEVRAVLDTGLRHGLVVEDEGRIAAGPEAEAACARAMIWFKPAAA